MTNTTNTNNILSFRAEALVLCETLLTALHMANALGSYHELQVGGTWGGIYDALRKALWCEIRVCTLLTPDQIDTIVEVLRHEAIENGENISYQIDLWNKGIITA